MASGNAPGAIDTAVLDTLDPAAPDLDDLEPLRALVAGARVVGVVRGRTSSTSSISHGRGWSASSW
ncbi:hypothetical protein ACN3XK_24125, partial [Actinomadura welshii]